MPNWPASANVHSSPAFSAPRRPPVPSRVSNTRSGVMATKPLATRRGGEHDRTGRVVSGAEPGPPLNRSRFSKLPLTIVLPPPPSQPSSTVPYTERKSTLASQPPVAVEAGQRRLLPYRPPRTFGPMTNSGVRRAVVGAARAVRARACGRTRTSSSMRDPVAVRPARAWRRTPARRRSGRASRSVMRRVLVLVVSKPSSADVDARAGRCSR